MRSATEREVEMRAGELVSRLVLCSGVTVLMITPDPALASAQRTTFSAKGVLSGVTATSAQNAWSAGFTGASTHHVLIVHWNGHAWKQAAGLGAIGGSLTGITAISANDAWAVGTTRTYPTGKTLVLHWNGKTWKKVASLTPGTGSEFTSVTATSARDVWAAGNFVSKTEPFGLPLVAHWNGHRWKRLSVPFGLISGTVATSARNAWIVGGTGGDGLSFPLILHWNGHFWNRQKTPPVADGGILSAVAATSAKAAWTVSLNVSNVTLILRWNGRTWKRVTTPRAATGGNLNGVASVSPASAWAVGSTGSARTLILHWNGKSWAAQ